MKKILRINPKESTLIIFSMKYYKRVCTPTIFPSPIISETMAKAMPLSYAVYLLSTTVPSCLKNTFVFNFFVVWFLLFSGLTSVFEFALFSSIFISACFSFSDFYYLYSDNVKGIFLFDLEDKNCMRL